MKLVSTSEDSYVVDPCYFGAGTPLFMSVTSPRVTQISPNEAAIGGILQRADSYRAIYVSEPVIVITVKTIDLNSIEVPNDLSRLQITTSITTFDTYATSVANGLAQSEDTYNFDAQLLATRGRLYFDLTKYATSQVLLRLANRTNTKMIVRVKTEVYSKGESIHRRQTEQQNTAINQVNRLGSKTKRRGK